MDKMLQKIFNFIDVLEQKLLEIKDESGINCLESIKAALLFDDNSVVKVQKLISAFDVIELIIENAGLSYHEKCLLVKKIILYNFAVVGNVNVLYLDYLKYKKEFMRVGIRNSAQLQQTLPLYLEDMQTSLSNNEIKDLFLKLIEEQKDYSAFLKGEYEKIYEFTLKKREESDYVEIVPALENVMLPSKLIQYYLAYYRKIDKKNSSIKEDVVSNAMVNKIDTTISKKELKGELSSYCNLNKELSFSYQNYERVLWLLGKLQYADTVNNSYFNYCYQNRVEDNYYYRFVFEKLKSDKKYKDIIEDILFYLDSMFICSEEDYIVAKEEILKMLDSVGIDTILNFDYENNEIKRVRGVKVEK